MAVPFCFARTLLPRVPTFSASSATSFCTPSISCMYATPQTHHDCKGEINLSVMPWRAV